MNMCEQNENDGIVNVHILFTNYYVNVNKCYKSTIFKIEYSNF